MREENKDIIDYKGMGARIKEQRQNNGMNIKQLSLCSNVDEAAISNIERGTKRSGLTSLVLISKALGVTTDYLLFGDTNRNADDNNFLRYNFENCDLNAKKAIYEVVETMVKAFNKK